MAKRFTDTSKWKKPFIKGLPAKYKLLWFYILDDCDHAGIWEVDFEVASLRIGESLTYEDAFVFLGNRVRIISPYKWFIEDFISFQYGELNPKNRLHLSVINLLSKYNIDVNKPLNSPLIGAKDKDKDKDKEKDKEEESVKVLYEVTPPDSQPKPMTITANIPKDDTANFNDYENWTEDVIKGNDPQFEQLIMREPFKLNGSLADMAKSYLTLLAEYPKKAPPDQHRFRIALIGHIRENIKKPKNEQQTKGLSGSISSQVSGTSYSGGLKKTNG